MQRWNGWGNQNTEIPLTLSAQLLLKELVGETGPGPEFAIERALSCIPETRIKAQNPCLSTDLKDRFDHAHGQSFPDWVGIRWGTLKHFPDGVAFPASEQEIEDVVKLAAREKMLVIPYGGGTSVVAHLSVPESDTPVLSLSLERFNRLTNINPYNMLATFNAGVRGPDLEAQLATHGYTLGHFPQSFELSTLGGWIATRSSGQQSRYYGRIEDMFAGGDLLTPKGKMHFSPFPASAAGPDLRHLLMGSEGRMGVVSNATVRIKKMPEADDVFGFFFPSWDAGVEALRETANSGLSISMARLSNPVETATNMAIAGHEKQIEYLKRYLRLRGQSDSLYCMALIGFTGSKKSVSFTKHETCAIIRKYKGISVGKAMGNIWKKNRFLAPYLRNTLWEKGYAADTLETAVTWDKVRPVMAVIENSIRQALEPRAEKVHVFSHLSHIYPTGSSIYTTYLFKIADSPEETLNRWQTVKMDASMEIVNSGGTISHQHGVGIDHRIYLPAEKGAIGIDLIKKAWKHIDPDQIMNPGKLTE